MPIIEHAEQLPGADREAILKQLDEHMRDLGFVWEARPLFLVLRDDDGAVGGGLMGELTWGWLYIRELAVRSDMRGNGWGRSLMAEAERIARSQGGQHVWLDTFSFQARAFYEKLGYRVFGELPGFPRGETRYFLTKPL